MGMAEQTDFFFGVEDLNARLSKLGDPLEILTKNIPWSAFGLDATFVRKV